MGGSLWGFFGFAPFFSFFFLSLDCGFSLELAGKPTRSGKWQY